VAIPAATPDGTNADEIWGDEPALADGAFGLTWSPTGNRIAIAEETLIAMASGYEAHTDHRLLPPTTPPL
jgi:hypothetical protein